MLVDSEDGKIEYVFEKINPEKEGMRSMDKNNRKKRMLKKSVMAMLLLIVSVATGCNEKANQTEKEECFCRDISVFDYGME